ncbi:unnamed protein product [Nezara viridula]|uniref:GPI ethanolamine phosphate transferase 1 n=1 Tax=Nezara viridula TaxID=85310 RepID=A0A9P0E7B2_NEZVI|nr:unnamed protein product [Nezara viridula]
MSNISESSTPDNWKLAHLCRNDVNQVDIAVLMSILLGVTIPVHSVGTLPLNFLAFSEKDRAKAYVLNARQLITQLKAKEYKVKSHLANCLFHPYSDISFMNYEDILVNIEEAINNSDFRAAENLTHQLIMTSLAGLDYYNTYFQNFLLTCTVLSFLGLGTILVAEIIVCNCRNTVYEFERELSVTKREIFKTIYSFLFSSIFALGYVDALPHRYMIYPLIPITLCYWIILKYSWILKGFYLFNRSTAIKIVLYGLGSQLIILSFHQKWIISLTLIGFCFWPGLGFSPVIDSKHAVAPRKFRLFWCFSCVGLSIFPLLPIIVGEEEVIFKIFTGFAWIIVELIIFNCNYLKYLRLTFNLVSLVQFVLTPLILWNIYTISSSFKNGEGLHIINQCTSCSLLLFFLYLMYYGPKRVMSRFNTLSCSVGLTFLMFSSSYEAIFPLLLAANLICWILFERMVDIRYSTWPASVIICDEIGLFSHDFRRSFFFVFYIILTFFGIGNVASLNSFDMVWVHSFVRSFSPLTIMSLMMVKILLPCILVTSAFRSVCYVTNTNSKVLFMIALLICDFMAVQFLLSVTNRGSTLEIEKSISHFVIMQSISIFLFILNSFTKYITSSRTTSFMDCDNVLRKWHEA